MKKNRKIKIPLWIYFLLSLVLCLLPLWACSPQNGSPVILDLPEVITQVQHLESKIHVNPSPLPDILPPLPSRNLNISEPLPDIGNYHTYGLEDKDIAPADKITVEIYSSTEKSNGESPTEGWLTRVFDKFKARHETVNNKPIELRIRSIPSGAAARLITAGATKPNAYTPSNSLWLSMLKAQGVNYSTVAEGLVPNTAGLVISDSAYQAIAQNGEVTFDRLLDSILAGNLTVGYANPYESSTAMNLLYTIFWRAAGHQADGQPLTESDLNSQQVNSVFDTFQKRVVVTTTTTLDLLTIYQRQPDKLDTFPLEYQNYLNLKQQPEFNHLHFVSFGIAHDNPLVSFGWNSPEQEAALAKFTQFALSPEMQQLASEYGFVPGDDTPNIAPPIPDGEILLAAQKYWKKRKDLGRTVYLEMVVDVSGSMDGRPLNSLKEALKAATTNISKGNQVGLVSFADEPTKIVELDTYDELQQQRILTGIESLHAVGSTAIYDGLIVGMAELLAKKQQDPNGIYYLLLLSDGDRTTGLKFKRIQNLVASAGINILPIAYGDVNEQELKAIAYLTESTVKDGNRYNVKELMHQIFQTQM